MADLLQDQQPELLQINQDLEHVPAASKRTSTVELSLSLSLAFSRVLIILALRLQSRVRN